MRIYKPTLDGEGVWDGEAAYIEVTALGNLLYRLVGSSLTTSSWTTNGSANAERLRSGAEISQAYFRFGSRAVHRGPCSRATATWPKAVAPRRPDPLEPAKGILAAQGPPKVAPRLGKPA